MFQWGKESQLSSSVPLSVISNAAEYQQVAVVDNVVVVDDVVVVDNDFVVDNVFCC